MAITIQEIENLGVEEKIELAKQLWQSIEIERLQPLTDAQEKLLNERLGDHEINRSSGKSWREIKNKYSI